jgi:hypothetical protein
MSAHNQQGDATQHIISRVMRNKKAIWRVLGNNKDTSVVKALGPLKEFTDIMSASNYVTTSALKPILHCLSTTELSPQDDDLPLTVKIKNKVLTRLQARFVDGALKALYDGRMLGTRLTFSRAAKSMK